MNNRQISDLYISLLKFKDTTKDKHLPISISFAVARNIKLLEEIAKDIDDSRIGIINEYGDKDENGNIIIDDNDRIHIAADKSEACNEELTALFSYEPDVKLETISVEDIGKCDMDKYDSLTYDEVSCLENLVV